ncbi:unnamed protein product, partial [Rotaria sp. Silwood2]
EETLSLIDQLLATKFFICLLTITVIIVIAFTIFSIQTYTVTIQSPNEIIFEQLYAQYSTTLSCPCRKSSIRHNNFILLNPYYHPICTSQFINQTFISSLSDEKISDYYLLDYRTMIASHFQVIALLCRTIIQIVTNAIKEFATRYLITTNVLPYNIFNTQVVVLIKQLKQTTTTYIRHINDFLSLNIFHNGIYSGLRTNYAMRIIPGTTTVTVLTFKYTTLNKTCSCSKTNTCVQQAGISNRRARIVEYNLTTSENLTMNSILLFTIPGIMVGCLPYDSLLKSTLECFYNQSCIDEIQLFINGLSLVKALSSSHFEKNATVNDLFNHLFIEFWNEKINFSNYFHICSPHSCRYLYSRRFNLLYVIVTIISIFGGLKAIYYVSIPSIIMIIRRLSKFKTVHNKNNNIPTINQSVKYRFISSIREFYEKTLKLNIFPSSSETIDGIYSTRIYIFLLVNGMLVLFFYSSIIIRIHNNSVDQPSLNEYKQLYKQYASTLVCPCSHFSVYYSSIMYIKPYYHQVCSSDIVQDDRWLLYFNGFDSGLYAFDFRVQGLKKFILLQVLCKMSNETVTNELVTFNNSEFATAQVLNINEFNTQTSILIRRFQQQVLVSFRELFELVRTSIQLNQFLVHSSNNVVRTRTLVNGNNSYRFVFRTDWSDTCSCAINASCTRSEGFYCSISSCFSTGFRPNKTIPGLFQGCLPIDSLLLSSLECFYNKSCIDMLIQWYSFNLSNITIDSRIANITPLDQMIPSRFSPDTKLNNIVSQLFIEDWIISTNFNLYYNNCAPNKCSYTYEERFNRGYVIATILGIVGGLSTALRIFILPIVKVIRRVYYYCCKRTKHATRECFVETGKNYRS